ncbi:MAG: indolepyruvate ferredoxin oxidoreductase subunit alpha [Thermodesulfobacteriota bacterium]
MEKILQGNYAIARGAWEAGVKVACAYPGTPSSEVLFAIANQYKNDVNAEWSPNEKVALEVAIGASFAGARSIAAMKHVGLNVASDPFMTVSYTGIKGGLLIVVADDPYSHSSQNEQDSRHWARFGKVPMLEPSDSQECKDFTKLAFDISEEFDTPVLLRSETRVSHSFSPVKLEERQESTLPLGLSLKDAPKYTMVPIYVRMRRQFVEEKMKRLEAFADEFKLNIMEINDMKFGVITSGVCYNYTKEVFPEYSYLKLGMVWPLPKKLIAEFFNKVKKVIIVEELDPFLETEIRAMGFKIFHGKDIIPNIYEFSPEIIEKSLKGKKYKPPKERINVEELPKRPPNLCAGCSHRALFYGIKKLGLFVFGDIGCYTLATAPPLNAIHATICMGAGVGNAFGASKALGSEGLGKLCAVIGDSTFLHGGVTPLMDVVYNKGNSTTIILDNRTTGMTGLQEHPGTGYTIIGEPTHSIDFEELSRALGVKHVRKVDPYNLKETMEVIQEEVERDEPSVILTVNGPCMLHRREKRKFEHPFYLIDMDKCRGCGLCLEVGCPAISWREVSGEEAVTQDGHKRKGVVHINRLQCPGCSLCHQICKFEAIIPGKA